MEISTYMLMLILIAAACVGYRFGVISANLQKSIDKSIKDSGPANDDDDDDGDGASGSIRDSYGLLDAPYKMVLCVNMGLKMEKGKIAAQCSHATLGAFKMASQYSASAVRWWQRTGQAKIAVKIDNDLKMEELAAVARKAGLVTYIVMDAGRTQIAAGSKTVLAIGPAPVKVIDKFTSSLKLL